MEGGGYVGQYLLLDLRVLQTETSWIMSPMDIWSHLSILYSMPIKNTLQIQKRTLKQREMIRNQPEIFKKLIINETLINRLYWHKWAYVLTCSIVFLIVLLLHYYGFYYIDTFIYIFQIAPPFKCNYNSCLVIIF